MPRLLLIDDDPLVLTALEVHARRWGYEVVAAESARSIVDHPDTYRACDVVLADLWLPGDSGIELVRRIREVRPDLPIVVMSSTPVTSAVVEAIRAGARDFVEKTDDRGLRVDALRGCLERAVQELEFGGDAEGDAGVEPMVSREVMVGESQAMVDLRASLARVGPEEVNVLLLGESGVGKELCARAIHRSSPRRTGRLQTVNCAAFQETLLASELFGHEQGAFTGASSLRRGHFEVAAGGTVFLDEIGEAPPGVQASLLRVLQEGEIVRVGGTDPIPVDVRIVSATNRDLQAEAADGRFRRDLYYRLATFPVRVPPLRERLADIPSLVDRFLKSIRPTAVTTDIAPDALGALQNHDWPGNIRELQNIVQQASILAGRDRIEAVHVEVAFSSAYPSGRRPRRAAETGLGAGSGDPRFGLPLREAREEFDRAYLTAGLERVGGNVAQLAREAGVGRVTLYERLGRLGIDPQRFR